MYSLNPTGIMQFNNSPLYTSVSYYGITRLQIHTYWNKVTFQFWIVYMPIIAPSRIGNESELIQEHFPLNYDT